MTQSEYAEWVEESIPGYVADKVASGQWSQEEPLALSRKEHAELFPFGLDTPENHFHAVVDSQSVAVGMLWFVDGTGASATLALVVATIVFVAWPAHAFVLGFNRSHAAGPGALDVAFLVRVGAWLAGAVITALLVAALRGHP